MVINVLGTQYTIYKRAKDKDKYLSDKNVDGYCDKTSHKIVIREKDAECELDDFEAYQRRVMRHEIIHAFLFESGLGENWSHDQWGHDETYVDWIATQFPKISKAFDAAQCRN